MISLPVTLFSVAVVGAAASVLTIFVGAAIYDLKAIKTMRPLRAHPHAAPYRRRPLISVVFITRNNKKTIEESLQSAFTGSYRNIEVIVLDNASSDGTVATVRDFIAHNPKRAVKLTTKRTKATDDELTKTIRRIVRGELVMILRSGTIVDQQAIKTALQHFLVNEPLQALYGRRAVASEPSVVNQAQQLGNMVIARIHKARAGFGFKSDGRSHIIAYRRGALKTMPAPVYASNVVALSQHRLRPIYPKAALIKTLFWLVWAVPAAGIAYIWYVALNLHVAEPLGVLWLGATLGGLLFTLSDDYVSSADKLRSISVVPLWYLFSCIYLLLRVLSPLEALTRIRVNIRLLPQHD